MATSRTRGPGSTAFFANNSWQAGCPLASQALRIQRERTSAIYRR